MIEPEVYNLPTIHFAVLLGSAQSVTFEKILEDWFPPQSPVTGANRKNN